MTQPVPTELEKVKAERDLWIKRWNTIYNFICYSAGNAESNEEEYAYYTLKAAMEVVEKKSEEPGGDGSGAQFLQ